MLNIFSDDTVPPTFDRLTSSHVLPWGAPKERSRFPSSFNIETDIRPGEFVMRTLFAEFTVQVNMIFVLEGEILGNLSPSSSF